MGTNTSLCQAISTTQNFIKLGTSHQQLQEFLSKRQKIKQIIKTRFEQEINKCCVKYEPRRFVQGIYIGPVNSNFIPHTIENNEKGIFLYHQGFLYFGSIKNGRREEKGILISQDGDFYSGEWTDNNPDGQGQYLSAETKRTYKGQWSEGIQQGEGVQNYEDGSSYVGQFMNGLKHGKGRLTYPDGTFYDGQFKQNKIFGYGVSQSRFQKYEGEWQNGKMHGNGVSTWFDQNGQIIGSYIGQYKEGLKHGYGQYKWGQAKTYKGMWEQGDMKSQGVLLNYQ